MSHVYLATLGQRPEAITVALDKLLRDYPYEQIGILHTEPQHSGIADALATLKPVLRQDYEALRVRFHQLTHADGRALQDIDSQSSANAYYNAIVTHLREYIEAGYTIHLMVAGGRKAMTLYASLAASMLFRKQDRLWTVLSPRRLIQPGLFHIPTQYERQITLVRLPILQDGVGPLDFSAAEQQKLQDQFLETLTEVERAVVDTLLADRHLTHAQIAARLGKAPNTVGHQLGQIYKKLEGFVDLTATHKKQDLLDFLNEGR